VFLLSHIICLYICELYCTGSLIFCADTVHYYYYNSTPIDYICSLTAPRPITNWHKIIKTQITKIYTNKQHNKTVNRKFTLCLNLRHKYKRYINLLLYFQHCSRHGCMRNINLKPQSQGKRDVLLGRTCQRMSVYFLRCSLRCRKPLT
jgi:hypothetical protein